MFGDELKMKTYLVLVYCSIVLCMVFMAFISSARNFGFTFVWIPLYLLALQSFLIRSI